MITTTQIGWGAATATCRREPWAPTEYIANKRAKIGTNTSLDMSGMSQAPANEATTSAALRTVTVSTGRERRRARTDRTGAPLRLRPR